jgi:hypothetical protein
VHDAVELVRRDARPHGRVRGVKRAPRELAGGADAVDLLGRADGNW